MKKWIIAFIIGYMVLMGGCSRGESSSKKLDISKELEESIAAMAQVKSLSYKDTTKVKQKSPQGMTQTLQWDLQWEPSLKQKMSTTYVDSLNIEKKWESYIEDEYKVWTYDNFKNKWLYIESAVSDKEPSGAFPKTKAGIQEYLVRFLKVMGKNPQEVTAKDNGEEITFKIEGNGHIIGVESPQKLTVNNEKTPVQFDEGKGILEITLDKKTHLIKKVHYEIKFLEMESNRETPLVWVQESTQEYSLYNQVQEKDVTVPEKIRKEAVQPK